ncbi:MAG TPA: hypothetical protein VJ871_09045 [Bacteroidales bacterium]|nr:hypothetical protein [Bacteroidales bacterium]
MDQSPFTYEESLAVARLIWIVLFSNEEITRNESDFFQQTLQYLQLSQSDLEDQLTFPDEDAYATIRGMKASKRSECARLLRMAVNSDGSVDRRELATLNEVLMRAELFRPDQTKSDHRLEFQ